MIERLQRALEHLNTLPAEAQQDLAEQIEELAQRPAGQQVETGNRRTYAGAITDLPDTPDEMFDALDRIRHAATPTPPIGEDNAASESQ